MSQRMMVRSLLMIVAVLSLLAAPALAAGPQAPAESPRTDWLVEIRDLVGRAVGLLWGDGVVGVRTDDAGKESVESVEKVSGADESDSGSSMDPDG